MFRALLRVWTCLLACVVIAAAPGAGAQDKLDRLARELKTADDFRVRTQAALALGASKNKRALSPLCSGLGDSNATVRAASAAAIGKLKLGGKACLEKRLAKESSGSVKSSIKKALTQIEVTAGSGEPAITNSTKYYLAIGKVIDKSGRDGKEVESIVRKTMSKAASAMDGYAVAPNGEKEADAKKRIAKFKQLKAFMLSPKVAEPKYTNGNLTVKIEVAIFTYPGKALKGTIPVKLTQQDVSPKDAASEDELIRMAAERVIEKFAENVERIQ
jgi:hypothetical protein